MILVLLSNCENNYLERGYLLRQGFCLLSEDRIMSLSVPVDKDLGEMCGISFEAERSSFVRSYLIFFALLSCSLILIDKMNYFHPDMSLE